MTYLLPPLNPLRAFEASARHRSYKLAAYELHVTPGVVVHHVKTLEERLGVRLLEKLHKHLILTSAGQDYVVAVRTAFRTIADATARLQPPGAVAVLAVGVHTRFDLDQIDADGFRAANPTIGLRIMQPAGLQQLAEGKLDALIERSLGYHPGYRSDRLVPGSGGGDHLICPEDTADCPEMVALREWLQTAVEAAQRIPRLVAHAD